MSSINSENKNVLFLTGTDIIREQDIKVKIFELIAAGGDTAMIAVAWALWKLNTRVSTLEGYIKSVKMGA